MSNLWKTLAAAAVLAATLQAQNGTLSQTNDSTNVITGTSIACTFTNPAGALTGTGDGSYWRSYNLIAENVFFNVDITQVTFGVEQAIGPAGSGSQPITINIYQDPNPDPTMMTINTGTLNLVHTQTFTLNDTANQVISVPLTSQPSFIATDTIVVEIHAADSSAQGGIFFIGANNLGETAPSYFTSVACGITAPTTYPAINPTFTTVHVILDMDWIVTGSQLNYPGSGEDLDLFTSVGMGALPSGGVTFDVKQVAPGDILNVLMVSQNGTYDFMPPILVGELFTTGSPPVGPAAPFDAVHFNPTSPNLFPIIVGNTPSPLGFQEVLLPGGNLHVFVIPPALSGMSFIMQALVTDSAATNGFFAITDGHEIQFL
ncbi:MAG TPA: hypothetical protein ENK43_11115 [Planctomycetes bacterium]|nr:hypothetical protein [Planctomycetota bacterium]